MIKHFTPLEITKTKKKPKETESLTGFKKFNFLPLPILILVLSFFWSAEVKANGFLEFTFEKIPLFEETNFLPEDRTTSWIKVKNNSSQTQSIFIWTDNVIDPANFGNILNLKIKEGVNTLYDNSLSHLFSQTKVFLSDLSPGNQTQYDLTVIFNILAGNEYQGKNLQFDFLIDTFPPEGGGGGAPITLQIFNVRTTNITENQATITWQTTLSSTSQVIYSAEDEGHNFDLSNPPKYGYAHIFPLPEDLTMVTFHTVLLSGLKPCTTYYYQVISHQGSLSSLTISSEYSFTTLCLGIGEEEKEKPSIFPPVEAEEKITEERLPPVTPPAIGPGEAGEGPAVAGEEITEGKPEEKPTSFLASMLAAIGSGLGNLGKILTSCIPWWLILIFAIPFLIKGAIALQKSEKERITWFTSILIPIILANWLFLSKSFCLPIWIFLILALATIFGCWLNKEITKRKIKKAPGGPPLSYQKKITSPVFFLLTGFLITICFFFIPWIYDPLVIKALPIESIDEDQKLIDYLNSIQNQDNIIIGVHGYLHKCPICGEAIHEYYCPKHEMPFEMVQERIEKGINIFKKAGLDASWIEPPGMTYDDKFLNITKMLGYTPEHYSVENFEGVQSKLAMTILKSKGLEKLNKFKEGKSDKILFKEYTDKWGKRKISQEEYNVAKLELEKDISEGINGILFHIQDYNNWTEALLKEALQNYKEIQFLRVDDIASNYDLFRLEKLVNLAKENNRLMLIAVIPAHYSNPGNLGLSSLIKTTWLVFVSFFLFPIAVMLPLHWYERGKIRRAKRKIPGSPKVSLIFPAYNEEKFIHKTIEQGLKQDYKGELEIIIIDDGSTDKTFEIVNESTTRHSQVKVYKQDKNLGKPAALNTGFEKATGEISIFCDSDSYLDSDLVSRMVPHFDDPQVGMVAGMIIIDNEINLLTKLQQMEYLYNQEIIRFCQATHKSVLICPGAATAVRTKIAREIPSTDRTITEDADFTFEVAKAGWKVSQEPEAISRTDAPENWEELISQRKRWLYGVIQTIWLHKWALFYKNTKTPNLWVWWAWIGYITCPITVFAVLGIPLFIKMIGISYLIFLGFYSTLVGAIFIFAHWYGIKQYTHSNKTKLALLLPIYMVYQYILNVLLFYLVIAFVMRRGITVRYGGRDIHAI